MGPFREYALRYMDVVRDLDASAHKVWDELYVLFQALHGKIFKIPEFDTVVHVSYITSSTASGGGGSFRIIYRRGWLL